MGVVDRMKHHWWWLSIPATLALERLLAYFTSFNLLGKFWQTVGPALRVDLTFPTWALIVLVAPLLLIIAWLYRARLQLRQSLASVVRELEELHNPPQFSLDALPQQIMFWLAALQERAAAGRSFYARDLMVWVKLPLLEIETALDSLNKRGLLAHFRNTHSSLHFSEKGREYFFHESVKSSYADFLASLSGSWQPLNQ